MLKRIVLCAAVMIVAIVASVSAAPSTPTPRTCFPAAKWSAAQQYRPCVRVLKVYEDGSFTYSTEDANGTQRYDGEVGADGR